MNATSLIQNDFEVFEVSVNVDDGNEVLQLQNKVKLVIKFPVFSLSEEKFLHFEKRYFILPHGTERYGKILLIMMSSFSFTKLNGLILQLQIFYFFYELKVLIG